MERATLKLYEVLLHIECPRCNLAAEYRNHDIPQSEPVVHNCSRCNKKSEIPPFQINVCVKHDDEDATVESKISQRAKKFLSSQGFSKSESSRLVDYVYKQGLSLNETIKEAIASYE